MAVNAAATNKNGAIRRRSAQPIRPRCHQVSPKSITGRVAGEPLLSIASMYASKLRPYHLSMDGCPAGGGMFVGSIEADWPCDSPDFKYHRMVNRKNTIASISLRWAIQATASTLTG